MKKRLLAAKAEAGLATNDRIALAQLASVRQELGKLRTVQTDLEEARALLERGRRLHSVDRKRICRLEEEIKAIGDIEQQLLISRVLAIHLAKQRLSYYQHETWLTLIPSGFAHLQLRSHVLPLWSQGEVHAAKIQNESLLKELEKAQDASKSLQDLSERAIWANKREAQKTDELRVATEEARRLQLVVDQYSAEIDHLKGENAMLTKGLEDFSKQQLQDLANALTESQKLSMELDISKSENNRLTANIQHMQETEQNHVEALRKASEEKEALSCQLENLQRHLGTAQLEAFLELVRQQHRDQEKRDRQLMEGMRKELKEANMQHEAVLLKKKQLRDQLRETTRALHITRVKNEEVHIPQKHRKIATVCTAEMRMSHLLRSQIEFACIQPH
ncbi:hypothetical protein ACSSS7_007509 [Eimeria intestinalis]